MTSRAVRLSAALAIVAGALALSGCGEDQGGYDTGASGCYAPLACGPMYPVVPYPYMAHPYLGLLVNPAHTLIVMDHGAARVTYKPYSPPLRPAYRPPPPVVQKAAQPAAKPAPAPANPAPAVRTSRK